MIVSNYVHVICIHNFHVTMSFQLIDWPIENHFKHVFITHRHYNYLFKDVYEFRDIMVFSSLISYMIQEGNADKYTVYIFIIWNIISHYYSYIYYITWKIGTRLHNTAIKEEFVDVKLPTSTN